MTTDMNADTTSTPGKGKLLLVEDDPVSAHAYTLLLEKGGFEVVHASDGQEALEALYHTDFAVVIMDLVLPRCDGIEILKKMRAMPRHEQTPTVVLTSADLAMTRQTAREHGVIQFLTKGQESPDQLLSAIEHISTLQPGKDGPNLRMLPSDPAKLRKLKDVVLDPFDRELPEPEEPKPGLLKKIFDPEP